jgi:hypothetical protein
MCPQKIAICENNDSVLSRFDCYLAACRHGWPGDQWSIAAAGHCGAVDQSDSLDEVTEITKTVRSNRSNIAARLWSEAWANPGLPLVCGACHADLNNITPSLAKA